VIKNFRFLDVPYFSPAQNMALDEALMQNFTSKTTPIFRLYTWENNAFSIGRFQDLSKISNFDSFGKNFTRRITGGGLLLHGFDVSYSLIIPSLRLANKSVKQGYEFLCSFLYTFYRKLGLEIDFAKDILSDKLASSVFCQVGFEPYDIIIQGKKIGGNAQKRSKNFIYQHGSIPLHVDSRPFSGTSLEALGIKLSVQEAKELLKQAFQSTFDIMLTPSELTNKELAAFESLHVNKYTTKEWKYESISTKL